VTFSVVGKVEIDVGSVNVVVSVENVMELDLVEDRVVSSEEEEAVSVVVESVEDRVVNSEEEEGISVVVSAMVVEVEVVSTDVVEVDIVVSSVDVDESSVEDEEMVTFSVVEKVETEV